MRVTAPPLLTMACHCTGCQRMSASAYSLSMAIPAAAFKVIQGDTVIGGLHGEAQHNFCAWCMSWMFTRLPGMPFVNVRPTLMDDPSGFEPFIETYRAEALAWAATTAVHSFDRFPPMDACMGLIADYAKGQGREPSPFG